MSRYHGSEPPVIDLAMRFGNNETALTETAPVMVMNNLLGDGRLDLILAVDRLLPSPGTLETVGAAGPARVDAFHQPATSAEL